MRPCLCPLSHHSASLPPHSHLGPRQAEPRYPERSCAPFVYPAPPVPGYHRSSLALRHVTVRCSSSSSLLHCPQLRCRPRSAPTATPNAHRPPSRVAHAVRRHCPPPLVRASSPLFHFPTYYGSFIIHPAHIGVSIADPSAFSHTMLLERTPPSRLMPLSAGISIRLPHTRTRARPAKKAGRRGRCLSSLSHIPYVRRNARRRVLADSVRVDDGALRARVVGA